MQWVVWVSLVVLSCKSPQPPASMVSDAIVDDAATADGLVMHGESFPLGLNDVTMLFLLPVDPMYGVTVGRLDGVPGHPGDLISRDLFDRLVTSRGDVPHELEGFHVVGLRFDLCDRLQPGPCPAGVDGQMRLVFQPVGNDTGSETEAFDVALHASYVIPAAELAWVVDELRALARLRGFQTESPLAVNDSIASTSPPSEYRTRLRSLISRYGRESSLVRLTLFALQSERFTWAFRGLQKTVSAEWVDIVIPAIDQTEQRAALVDTNFPSFVVAPFVDQPAGLARALDNGQYRPAPLAEKLTSLAGLAAAQNPTLEGFATQQCLNCHVSTFLLAARAKQDNLSPSAVANTFTSPRNLSVSFGVLETEYGWRSLRALGWVHRQPAISQRVVNESAMVLDEIDQRFPPRDGVVTPFDGGILDAPGDRKRVFVTHGQFSGDLKAAGNGTTGLDGADRVCERAAATANLGGTWVAWLSSSDADAIQRVTGSGPWYLVDRETLVFADRAALITGPTARIDLTEHQAQPSGAWNVWTGTSSQGTTEAGSTCMDWTSAASSLHGMTGLRTSTDDTWTAYGSGSCNTALMRLYCFEQ